MTGRGVELRSFFLQQERSKHDARQQERNENQADEGAPDAAEA